jgi:hypothetical protein
MLSRKISRNRIKKFSKTKKYLGKGGSRGSSSASGFRSSIFPNAPTGKPIFFPEIPMSDPFLKQLNDNCIKNTKIVVDIKEEIAKQQTKFTNLKALLKDAQTAEKKSCDEFKQKMKYINRTQASASGIIVESIAPIAPSTKLE